MRPLDKNCSLGDLPNGLFTCLIGSFYLVGIYQKIILACIFFSHFSELLPYPNAYVFIRASAIIIRALLARRGSEMSEMWLNRR